MESLSPGTVCKSAPNKISSIDSIDKLIYLIIFLNNITNIVIVLVIEFKSKSTKGKLCYRYFFLIGKFVPICNNIVF